MEYLKAFSCKFSAFTPENSKRRTRETEISNNSKSLNSRKIVRDLLAFLTIDPWPTISSLRNEFGCDFLGKSKFLVILDSN